MPDYQPVAEYTGPGIRSTADDLFLAVASEPRDRPGCRQPSTAPLRARPQVDRPTTVLEESFALEKRLMHERRELARKRGPLGDSPRRRAIQKRLALLGPRAE
jgi:hypothetical protein